MADEKELPPGTISQNALNRWAGMPRDKAVEVALTTQDLDHLFLAIREMVIAHGDLRAAMLAYTQGKQEAAQTAFDSSGMHQDNAFRNINNLITKVMLTARPL